MQLKKLKKRLNKQRLITRREYMKARRAGTQVPQFKDVLYTGPRTKILREKPRPPRASTSGAVTVDDD